DVTLAAQQPRNLGLIDVQPENLEPDLAVPKDERQADIAQSDDGYDSLSRGNLFDQAMLHMSLALVGHHSVTSLISSIHGVFAWSAWPVTDTVSHWKRQPSGTANAPSTVRRAGPAAVGLTLISVRPSAWPAQRRRSSGRSNRSAGTSPNDARIRWRPGGRRTS